MQSYGGSRDAAGPAVYAPVPPLLVNTSALETYLDTLSRQLRKDVSGVRKEVHESTIVIAETRKSLNELRLSLLGLIAKQMSDRHDDGRGAAPRSASGEEFLSMFANAENLSEKDLFQGMITLATQLLSDNEELRGALRESTEAMRQYEEGRKAMTEQLAESNYRMKCQQKDFHELSLWLGTYDPEEQRTRPALTAADHSVPQDKRASFENAELATATDSELESTIAQSPLLLAFRRILLRDMVDRVSHTADLQAREVGTVVADMKEDIKQCVTPEGVVNMLDTRNVNEAQTLVATYAKRLKDIEDTYVRKDEFSTVMRSKADSILIPIKADSAVVTNLERRVFDKYAELEERVAFFEAEREEFRDIIRALLALQQQQQENGFAMVAAPISADRKMLPPIAGGTRGGPRTTPPVVRLGDVLQGGVSDTSDTNNDTGPFAGSQSHGGGAVERPGKAIYRVIGADRDMFATAVTGSAAMSGAAATAPSARPNQRAGGAEARSKVATQKPREAPQATTAPSHSASPPTTVSARQNKEQHNEFIPMTANQVAYAHLVSGQLSREDVKKHSVLPYESAR